MAAAGDGRIYAIGGNTGDQGQFDVEAYNPANGTWAGVQPALDPDAPSLDAALPRSTGRWGPAAVNAPCPDGGTGCIYVMGGSDDKGAPSAGTNTVKNAVEVYDWRAPGLGWKDLAPMPTARRNFGATLGSDGRIYAVGGGESNDVIGGAKPNDLLKKVEAYAPATNTWTSVDSLPTPRQRGVRTASDSAGRIYVLGGNWGSPLVDKNTWFKVQVYDPAKTLPRWEEVVHPMTEWRENGAAASGSDGRVYALGGVSDRYLTVKSVEAYTPQSVDSPTPTPTPTPTMPPNDLDGQWETLSSSMDTARADFGATAGILADPATAGFVPDRRIYAVGGNAKFLDGDLPNGGEAYDLANKKWTTLPPMLAPRGRVNLAAVTDLHGRIYAIGGEAVPGRQGPDTDIETLATVERFDPQKPQLGWAPVPPISRPRVGLSAVTGSDGRIYAIGGADYRTSENPTNTVEAYNPDLPQLGWLPVASMLVPRKDFGAAVGSDGRIYAVGGTDDSFQQSTSVEAYDPKKPDQGWVGVAALPAPAYSDRAVAAGPDGRIYAMGGFGCAGQGTTERRCETVQVYDPITRRWAEVAPMPTGRIAPAATLGPDNRIYALGGSPAFQVDRSKVVEAYTQGRRPLGGGSAGEKIQAPDTWVGVAPMTRTRSTAGIAAGLVPDDPRIYAIGGASSGGEKSAEVYVDGSWRPLPAMSFARTGTAAATGSDGRIYAISGQDTLAGTTAEAFNPTVGKWELIKAHLSRARPGLEAVSAPCPHNPGQTGCIYALGGGSSETVEVYDPSQASKGWVPAASMPTAMMSAAAVGSDGRIYALGTGADQKAHAWVYDPKNAELGWVPVAEPNVSKAPGMAAAGPDGRIYAIGAGQRRNEAHVYDPKTPQWGWVRKADLLLARSGAAVLGPDKRIYAVGATVEPLKEASVEAYKPGPRTPPIAITPASDRILVNGPFTEFLHPDADNPGSDLASIAPGADGKIWFGKADGREVGQMTTAGIFGSKSVSLSNEAGSDMAMGADGSLWFTLPNAGKIGRLLSTGDTRNYALPVAGTLPGQEAPRPASIVAGPDGMWFTELGASRIGLITPAGAITEIAIPGRPATAIGTGSDGNIWFTNAQNALPDPSCNGCSPPSQIGRITRSGAVTIYPLQGLPATAMVSGPGGALWFGGGAEHSAQGGGSIGRIDPNAPNPGATIERFPMGSAPGNMVHGRDGNLWVLNVESLMQVTPLPLPSGGTSLRVTGYRLPKSRTAHDGRPAPAIPMDIALDPGGSTQYLWFTEAGAECSGCTGVIPGAAIGRFDITHAGKGNYTVFPLGPPPSQAPGQGDCRTNGDPAANFEKTSTVSCTIASSGPLTHVIVSPDPICQVWHRDDQYPAHYPGGLAMSEGHQGDGECATLLGSKPAGSAGEYRLYGPKSIPCYYWGTRRPFEPAEGVRCGPGARTPDQVFKLAGQRGVGGSGTEATPFTIVTMYEAGDLKVTQTDSYVVGQERYRTDVQITNAGGTPSDVLLTRAGDCYAEKSDRGGGRYTPETGAVACTDGPRIVEWQPISPGSRWFAGDRESMWRIVGNRQPFPNRCVGDPKGNAAGLVANPLIGRCENLEENGAGLTWESSLRPGETMTRSHYTVFAPFGGGTRASVSDTKVAEPATPGGEVLATFDVSLENPMPYQVAVDWNTTDDTALAGSDYRTRSGQVVFPAGETVKQVSVPVLGDVVPEPTEQFLVTLSVPGPLIAGAPAPQVDLTNPAHSGPGGGVSIDHGVGIGVIQDNGSFLPDGGQTDGGSFAGRTTFTPTPATAAPNRGGALLPPNLPPPVPLIQALGPGQAQTQIQNQAQAQAQNQTQAQTQAQSQAQSQAQAQSEAGIMSERQRESESTPAYVAENVPGATVRAPAVHLASARKSLPLSPAPLMGWAIALVAGIGLAAQGRLHRTRTLARITRVPLPPRLSSGSGADDRRQGSNRSSPSHRSRHR